MLALFLFPTLILTCFSQATFECCNNCEETAECSAPFYWPKNECDTFREPFWPDNFCLNSGEDCQRGTCHCTQGYDAVEDPTTGEVIKIRIGNICVRSLREPIDEWGKWLCDNSDTCPNGECPDGYYCVNACCDDENGQSIRRCVPCCNEPLRSPTSNPTKATPDPTPKTPEPTPSTRYPTRNTREPTQNPVATEQCVCDNPKQCQTPFDFGPDLTNVCMTNTIITEPVWCPAMGTSTTIRSRCKCTYEGETTQPSPVCIKEPTEQFDITMCRCAQTCQPGDPNQLCPPNHYCVHTCCEQTGNDPYKCVPCCDTPWLIPNSDTGNPDVIGG